MRARAHKTSTCGKRGKYYNICVVRLCCRSHRRRGAIKLKKSSLQLSLSRKGTGKSSTRKTSLLPGEIYNIDTVLPSGISNVANICYGSSVLQCLFNHGTFRNLCTEITAQHANDCISCRPPGYNIIFSVHGI